MLDPRIAERSALLLLSVCAFSSMASLRMCDAMLPHLATEFSASLPRVAVVISSFALAYGVLQIFYGPLGDRFGKIRVVGWATLLCTVGSAGATMAPTLDWLIAWRTASGAAAAGIIPLAMAWVGDNVAYERRQEVLARFLGATVFGMICGQWLGGWIASTAGWRTVFGLMTVTFFVAGIFAVARGSITATIHIHQQVKARDRILNVFSISWSRVILTMTFLEGALVFGVIAFIPTFLHERYGLSTAAAGAVTAMYGVGGLLYSRLARMMLSRVGETGLAKGGGGCLGIAFVTIAAASHWAWAIPACFLAGFGFYALHNTLQVHATQMAPRFRGTAVSLFACVLFIGQSVGVVSASFLAQGVSLAGIIAIAGFCLAWVGWRLGARITGHAREAKVRST